MNWLLPSFVSPSGPFFQDVICLQSASARHIQAMRTSLSKARRALVSHHFSVTVAYSPSRYQPKHAHIRQSEQAHSIQ